MSLDALNVNVLNVAKDEYTKQLVAILGPLVLQGCEAIYEDSKHADNERDVIYNFQVLLKQVPTWNSNMISEECARISATCDWLHDLITAVFVTNVKILTSVKIINKAKQFKLKMPNFDTFVHAVYIESARHFFHNPFQLYEYEKTTKRNKNRKEALKAVGCCIEETIRQLLPVRHILQEYMQDNGCEDDDYMNHVEKNSIHSASDVMDPDITRRTNTNQEQLKGLVQRDLKGNVDMIDNDSPVKESPVPLFTQQNDDNEDDNNNFDDDNHDDNEEDGEEYTDESSKQIMVQPRDSKSKKFVEHHNTMHPEQPPLSADPLGGGQSDDDGDDLSDISD